MFRLKQKKKIFLIFFLILLWMYSPCLARFNDRYFNYPVSAPLSIGLDFGQNLNDQHKGHLGVDYEKPKDTPVYATANGQVVNILRNHKIWGNAIMLKHELINGEILYSQYAHLSKIMVHLNQIVLRGDEIGFVGNTGSPAKTQLHFEIKSEEDFGTGYKGACFSKDQITYNGAIYLNPSNFIKTHCKIPLTGDWDNDEEDEIGIYRTNNSKFLLKEDMVINFGNRGDIPVVGDWDADGRDDIGIFRKYAQRKKDKCAFYWDLDLTGENADFPPILLGNDKCIPITGDWNGNGFDTIGVFDPSKGKFYLDYNHDGIVEKTLVLRAPGKIPITGDWDGDGIDDIGICRIDGNMNKFYLDKDLTGRQVEYTTSIACPKKNIDFFDIPIVGDWDGDGIDDIAIYRPSTREIFIDTNKPAM